MRDPSIFAARRRGVATTPVTGGAASCGPGSSAAEGRGTRVASTSQSTRSMLPKARGAGAAATGDGAFRGRRRQDQSGLHLPEHPINAPRGAGSQRRRHRRRCIQSASRRWTLKGQGTGGPGGSTIHLALHRRPDAQGAFGTGRSPGGDLRFVPAARGAPVALCTRARSSGGGGGRGIHCLGKH
jgi:hypothetical protein